MGGELVRPQCSLALALWWVYGEPKCVANDVEGNKGPQHQMQPALEVSCVASVSKDVREPAVCALLIPIIIRVV